MSAYRASPLGKIRVVVITCCLLLILGIFGYAYLNDKNNSVLEKEDILDRIESTQDNDFGYTYLSSYLKKYGIGNLNTYKINGIESTLEKEFYKSLPEEKELAKSVALLFLEVYYDKVDLNDKEAVTDAILNCLFSSIDDRYAYYRTKAEFEEYMHRLEGGDQFVGIGVLVSQDTLSVSMVFNDSGAEAAGIKARDIIWGVEDKTVEDTPKEDILNMLKGEVGTTVNVVVKRGDELLEFTVERKLLDQRSVYHEMHDDGIGYIQIIQFLENTPEQFKEAISFCEENGATALVIDVRYNPGGLLNSVVDIIDYLTPDDPTRRIGSYTTNGYEHVFYTDDGHSVDLPIAVICNSDTASAGELFTAAMQDYGNTGVLETVILGSTTYGKGVAQNSYTVYDSSGITFTIGYFNPPSNVNFNGIGVIPDIEVGEVDGDDAPLAKAKEEVLKLTDKKDGVELSLGAAA